MNLVRLIYASSSLPFLQLELCYIFFLISHCEIIFIITAICYFSYIIHQMASNYDLWLFYSNGKTIQCVDCWWIHLWLADIALSDSLVVYDLANQTIGWAQHNCEFHGIWSFVSFITWIDHCGKFSFGLLVYCCDSSQHNAASKQFPFSLGWFIHNPYQVHRASSWKTKGPETLMMSPHTTYLPFPTG